MIRDSFDMFAKPERGRFGDNETQHRPGRGPKVTGASDLIDLTLVVRDERPRSIAVTDDSKPGSKWIWLPRIAIEIVAEGVGGVCQITMPEWLAREKGFI